MQKLPKNLVKARHHKKIAGVPIEAKRGANYYVKCWWLHERVKAIRVKTGFNHRPHTMAKLMLLLVNERPENFATKTKVLKNIFSHNGLLITPEHEKWVDHMEKKLEITPPPYDWYFVESDRLYRHATALKVKRLITKKDGNKTKKKKPKRGRRSAKANGNHANR